MKTILSIILSLFVMVGFSQKTNQEKLDSVDNARSKASYDWNGKTTAQKTAEMQFREGLVIAIAKEDRITRRQEAISDSTFKAMKRAVWITHIQNNGYQADNSLADWKRLYRRSKLYPNDWEARAIKAKNKSQGIDDFIEAYKQIGDL